METFLAAVAKKKSEPVVLPVLTAKGHEGSCGDGCGCSGGDSCCGG